MWQEDALKLHVIGLFSRRSLLRVNLRESPDLVMESASTCSITKLQYCKNTISRVEAPKLQMQWDLTDDSQLLAVKSALHLSAIPESVLCRENELEKITKFCKTSITELKAGSLYICGCPGTGKTLTMENLRRFSVEWAEEAGMVAPDVLVINCTSLTEPKNIYSKILQLLQPRKKSISSKAPLEEIKKILSHRQNVSRQCPKRTRHSLISKKMRLMILDEMDFLISRDLGVLYELFQLPKYPNSGCILIGVANAIDLTERFLPKLRLMNCDPDIVSFSPYTKDQILTVIQQRLKGLPFNAFDPSALELCARKVAAASGDMRKALHICRNALEIFEEDVKERVFEEKIRHTSSNFQKDQASGIIRSMTASEVQIGHMAKALAKTFRSPTVEIIQSLPQHAQMVLCSAVRKFRNGKKDVPLGELNKAYLDFCKTTAMSALSSQEFPSICKVLADQGLLSLGAAREDSLRRVKLHISEDDVSFALQDVRFFRINL